jgi:hypothetical protein
MPYPLVETEVVDFTKVVTNINDPSEALALPCGVVVGDTYGGRSFNDNVAAILESRSIAGWHEVQVGPKRWTCIVLAR